MKGGKRVAVVTTVAGSICKGYIDGSASDARFDSPKGLGVDRMGNVFVADYQNHVIRKIDVNGQVTSFAGCGERGYRDGASLHASFTFPTSCLVRDNTILVAETGTHAIRKIDSGMVVSKDTYFRWKGTLTQISPRYMIAIVDTPSGDFLIIDTHIYVIRDGFVVDEFATFDQYADEFDKTRLHPHNDILMRISTHSGGDTEWTKTTGHREGWLVHFLDGIDGVATIQDHGRVLVYRNRGTVIEFRSVAELAHLAQLASGWDPIAFDFTGIYFAKRHEIKKHHFIVYWKKSV